MGCGASQPQRFHIPAPEEQSQASVHANPGQRPAAGGASPAAAAPSAPAAPAAAEPTSTGPKPLVVCGPSGVGKGTIIGELMKHFPDHFGFSVSHTTRKPRPGEEDGVHYHFTTREEMEKAISEGKFLEHADVHGNMYGTSIKSVEDVAGKGKVCVLDIDVQGAKQVKKSSLVAHAVFVNPPSFAELEKRLRGRGTETEEKIQLRLGNAQGEIDKSKEPGLFDDQITNNDVYGSAVLVADIVRKSCNMPNLPKSPPPPAQLRSDANIVFVLGGPGSGKGTQCERIVAKYGYAHLSAGDLLREEVASGSETGNMCATLMKEGKLVPMEVTIGLLKAAMIKNGAKDFLIDGFPRALDQAQAFEAQVMPCKKVLFFDCPLETMQQRLLKRGETSGRADDNIDTIKKRFDTFTNQSLPVITHYEGQSKAYKVSAVPGPEDVFVEVQKVMEGTATPSAPGAELRSDANIVFVLGGPGSGKGTQCERIVAKYGYAHLSAGDLLREEVASGSETGNMCATLMKEGKLVPMEVTIGLLKAAMIKNGAKDFLIDGFPRALDQAQAFEAQVMPCKKVLFFDCPLETMQQRLLKRGETSGRADDNIDTIKKRFDTFTNQSLPVITHYEGQSKAYKVSAVPGPEDVFVEVQKVMEGTATPSAPGAELRSDANIVFVLGGPGSGKGTQCERIVAKYGYAHLSAGDLLREEVASGSETGNMCATLMKEGKLVPMEVTIGLLKAAMIKNGAKDFLIDGFPRALDQAQAFEAQVMPCKKVLFFDCPLETMQQRLLKRGETSGRADDNIDTIKKRFDTFTNQSLPVITHYEGQSKAYKVSAVPGPEDVFVEVQKVMEGTATPSAPGAELRSDANIVFVLGGPGSGKGTQCERIVAKYGYAHLSAGDLLREEVASGSETGNMCATLMKEGKLVPMEVTIGLLKAAMIKNGAKDFLIDGFPRALDQAQAFEAQVMPCKKVLFFDCPLETMQQRLLKRGETSGRADDNIDTIKKRFDTFTNQSLPVITHYEAQGKAFKVSAVPAPEDVFVEVQKVMEGTAAGGDAVAAAAPAASAAAADGGPRILTLVHFNDIYNIEEGGREPVGGASRFATALKGLEDKKPLILFSGDAFNPSLMSTVTRGQQMVPVLNYLKVHTAAVGNHDFDFGVENLEKLCGECDFPWLMANVLDKKTGEPLGGAQRTRIFEWEGVKIGLVGLVEEEWLETLATVDMEEVDYLDFVEEGRRLAKELRAQGAELVFALSHMRVPNDTKLAAEVEEFDLILGGHDHHYEVRPIEPHGTLMVKSGTDFRELTWLTLTLGEPGTKPTVTHERIEVNKSVEEDEGMKAIVEEYTGLVGSKMGSVIGETSERLDGRFTTVRTRESNLGNFVCDVWKEACGADVVILNSGTLRSDTIHPTGVIKMQDLISILPMLDETVIIELNGAQIIEALENGVSQYPKLEGRFPQVAGINFTFDPEKDPGSRVVGDSVKIGGEPVDLEKPYKVATKAYLALGKDGYNVFAEGKMLVDGETGTLLPTAIRNHFTVLSVMNGFREVVGTVNVAAGKFAKRLLNHWEEKRDAGHDVRDPTPLVHRLVSLGSIHHHYMISPVVEGRIVCLGPDVGPPMPPLEESRDSALAPPEAAETPAEGEAAPAEAAEAPAEGEAAPAEA